MILPTGWKIKHGGCRVGFILTSPTGFNFYNYNTESDAVADAWNMAGTNQ